MLDMELEWILLARQAILGSDGTVDIKGAAVNTLAVTQGQFPVRLQITIAGRVSAPMDEWREPGHALQIEIYDTAGKSVKRIREPLREIKAPTMLRPGALPGRLLALPLHWTAHQTGVYVIRVSLDGRPLREFSISVVQQRDVLHGDR